MEGGIRKYIAILGHFECLIWYYKFGHMGGMLEATRERKKQEVFHMTKYEKYLTKVKQGKKNYEAITMIQSGCVLIKEGKKFPLKKFGMVFVQNGVVCYQYHEGGDDPEAFKGICIAFKHGGAAVSFPKNVLFEHDEDSSENNTFLLFYYRWGTVLHIIMAKQGNKMLVLENYDYSEVDESSEQFFLEILFSAFAVNQAQTGIESEEGIYE